MAQYRNSNPFDAHFALPANVMAEPPGRGTITTAQIRRKSFGAPGYIPQAWRSGMAVPGYIESEPLGRGTTTTYQLPRRTISTLVRGSLGASDPGIAPGFPGDPFKQYGQRVAELIVGTIHRVPSDYRKVAVEALLRELDPGLPARVNARANEYKAKGMDPKSALQAAIASSVSEGFAREVVKIGQTGKIPLKSLSGLGAYSGAEAIALEGIWSTIKSVATAPVRAVKAAGSGIKTAATWTGGKVASGAGTAFDWSKSALSKIKGLTCVVMNNPLSDMAAGAAAASFGAPPQVGSTGKQLVQGAMCPPGTVPQETLTEPGGLLTGGGLPGWALPAGIGAAALVAVLLLRK